YTGILRVFWRALTDLVPEERVDSLQLDLAPASRPQRPTDVEVESDLADGGSLQGHVAEGYLTRAPRDHQECGVGIVQRGELPVGGHHRAVIGIGTFNEAIGNEHG